MFTIINGDFMNVALKTSVSDVYNERMTPMQQIIKAVGLLKPIREKILAVSCGNHENRTAKNDGVDIMRLVCREIDIEDRYTEDAALIFLRFGETGGKRHHRPQLYTIFINHGSGGGRKEGAKANRLADMASIVDADIFLHSHTHLPMILKEAFYRVDTANSTYSLVDKLFVNTGAFLNYGGYGAAFEMKPASKDTPHIFLNGKKREMAARL